MKTRLAGLRLWVLLFALLVGRQPVAADLMAGEGGMSHGLALAGFKVTAVDEVIRPAFTKHPNVTFVQGDALKFDLDGFDVVFASPPCQAFSTMKYAAGAGATSKEKNLIPAVRQKCIEAGVPHCIENVISAREASRFWRDRASRTLPTPATGICRIRGRRRIDHVDIERLRLIDVGTTVRSHVQHHSLLHFPDRLVQLLHI